MPIKKGVQSLVDGISGGDKVCTLEPFGVMEIIDGDNPPYVPTYNPTYIPVYVPTYSPTYNPTYAPTYRPTYIPTYVPTYSPTYVPTYVPVYKPTYSPTYVPTYSPSINHPGELPKPPAGLWEWIKQFISWLIQYLKHYK